MFEIARKTVSNYPFSVVCVVVIWVLSLTPFFPETPMADVPFVDKWTHFVMYGTLSLVIWCEYHHHHPRPCYRRLLIWGLLVPALMGGLLELLQEYATTTRSGEWLDALADAVGAIIGSILGLLRIICRAHGSTYRTDTGEGGCCRNGGHQ